MIVAGPIDAVNAALRALEGAAVKTVIIVGPGECDIDAPTTHVADWTAFALEPEAADAGVLVLAGAPTSRLAARIVLSRAAEARLKVMLFENGALRAMTIGDVVGRALAEMDWDCIRDAVAGKRVLITGGGGSIGGELSRRVAGLAPARLCVLENSEYNLFAIGRELPDAVLALCDVRDREAVRRLFERERPDIVFHTAALKHVPLVEAHPCEGLLTNVVGYRNAAEAALALGADFVFVSTDKAVNPSGVMGASKRLAELHCLAMDRESGARGGPRFISVRLGNVLGSSGSVSPVFERQIAAGGPLTVTDVEATRYFITIPQAADFLLQALAAGLSARASRGGVAVLDMGEPMAVVELGRKMIQLKGLRPDLDVAITSVGLRPGEKLHEELIAADEWRLPNPHPGVMAVASPTRALAELNETIERLAALARGGADASVAELLRASVTPAAASDDAQPAQLIA